MSKRVAANGGGERRTYGENVGVVVCARLRRWMVGSEDLWVESDPGDLRPRRGGGYAFEELGWIYNRFIAYEVPRAVRTTIQSREDLFALCVDEGGGIVVCGTREVRQHSEARDRKDRLPIHLCPSFS